jgi:hypothetical protein
MLKADELLESVAETIRQRRMVYGENDVPTGKILALMFPHGVQLETPDDYRMFLWLGHIVGKLTRFTGSGLENEDSLHDLMGYAALASTVIHSHTIKILEGKEEKHEGLEISDSSDFH